MTAPADLDERVSAAREELFALAHKVRELAEAYGELDADLLDVDNLGDPITPAAARTEAIDSLSDVRLALNDAAEAFDVAMRHTSRLKERA